MKKFLNLLLCVFMMFSSLSTVCVFADTSEIQSFSNSDIIVELAKAYDRQGAQILYDQYNARRSIYASPEDATAQRTIFLDCSSYVNSCYLEAFGVNILPYKIGATGTSPSTANYDKYAKENPDAIDVVGYWEPLTDCATEEDRLAVVDFISKNLQIGDVLTYRHGKDSATKGHTYIYVGNIKDKEFMHCAGAGSYVVNESNPALSYDSLASEITSNGTIGTAALYNIFKNKTHSRYIFKNTESDTVYSFSILRPFARGLTPTEETINRMKIAGLSMEKTSSVCENASVNTGDVLTYKVTLENTNATALTGVTITDTISDGAEFISGDFGITSNGKTVSWVGDVPGGATINVSYSVKITATVPGTIITSDSTYVSGVKLGTIKHSVLGYTAEQREKLGEKLIGYVADGSQFANTLEMAKTLYKSTFNANIFDYTTSGTMLDELIDTPNRTHFTTTEISKMIAPNMYGGLDIKNGWLYLESENDKVRLPKEEHLCVGDIIVADWSGGSTEYVYAGNKTLVYVKNGVAKSVTIGDDIYTPGDNIIISLLGYNRYAVLRPSQVLETPAPNVRSIHIKTPPSKLTYKNGESFNSQDMVVEAVLDDGTTTEITSYTISPLQLTYPTEYVTINYGEHSVILNVTVSQAPKSVSQAKALAAESTVYVGGIVVGWATESTTAGDKELLLKDTSNDNIIAVRNIPYGTHPDYGYEKGDIIEFYATVKVKVGGSSYSYNSGNDKKYLDFSVDNGTIDSTILSRGNKISYNFNNVIALNSHNDIKSKVVKTNLLPVYSYIKLSADVYMATNSTNHRIHKNAEATKSADIQAGSSRVLNLREDELVANVGDNWKDCFGITSTSTSYPGRKVSREFYALYIGGTGSFYQLVILDENWIYSPEFMISGINQNKTEVSLNIPKSGTYTVVFADYNGTELNNVVTSTITVESNRLGLNKVSVPEGILISEGDKIMLWNNTDDITPRCKAYTLKEN